MKVGKLSNELLKAAITDKIHTKRREVLTKPEPGVDCAVLDIEDNLCIISSDPITGAVNQLGKLAVHVACNDIASSGAEPVGLMITLLAPPSAALEDIENVMDEVISAADCINVDIIGGHTEITDSVNRIIVSCTCIGKVGRDKLIKSSGAKAGDSIILTKYAGIEGTSIIAHDKENELKNKFSYDTINKAKSININLSVIKEGCIGTKFEVHSMHDVTEGGVLGAVWELCEASGNGVRVYSEKIPVLDVTIDICSCFGINPLKLISSGCMLITCINPDEVIEALFKEGINASVIGEITAEKERYIVTGDTLEILESPGPDEIYRI